VRVPASKLDLAAIDLSAGTKTRSMRRQRPFYPFVRLMIARATIIRTNRSPVPISQLDGPARGV
jgi:hypothetical protein